MGKVVLVLWIAAVLFAGFWFGYYQEGANGDLTVEMKAEGSLVKGGKLYLTPNVFARVDEEGGKPTFSAVVNMKDKTLTLVDYETKRYASEDIELADLSECTRAAVGTPAAGKDVTRLADSKTIAGYRCHAFRVKTPQGEIRMWFSYEVPLGRSKLALLNKISRMKGGAALTGLAGMMPQEPDVKNVQYSSMEYFPIPLKVDITGHGANEHVEATKITSGKVDPSVFETPEGFEKVPMETLMTDLVKRMLKQVR